MVLYQPPSESDSNFTGDLKRKIVDSDELSQFNVITAQDAGIFKKNFCSPTVVQNLSTFSDTQTPTAIYISVNSEFLQFDKRERQSDLAQMISDFSMDYVNNE